MPLFGSKDLTPWRPAARPAPQWPLPSWTSRCPLPSRAKPGFSGPVDGRENPSAETERFPGEFLNHFCSATKKQKKKRGRSSTRFNGLHQQTFEERSHRSYITGTIMKAFQRLQVLNRWVGYQEASMYVCMHACMYLSIYLSMYLCIYVSMYLSMYLCIYVSMCIYIYVCATGINYVIYVICVQHVYIIYIC